MKTKLFRSLSYSFICIVLLTSCNLFISNTDFVKQSVFKDEASMKIGEALDNYKYFKKTEWTEFTTKQGKEVVEFNGYYNQNDIVVRIQFIINKDRQEDADGVNFRIGFEGYKSLNQSNDESKAWSSAYEGMSFLGLSIFADRQDRSSLMNIIYENAEIKRFSEIKNPEDESNIEKSSTNVSDINSLLLKQLTNPEIVNSNEKGKNDKYFNLVYEWSKLYYSLPEEFQKNVKRSSEIYEIEKNDFESLARGFYWHNSKNENMNKIGGIIADSIGYNDEPVSFRAGMVYFYVKYQLLKEED